MVQKLNINKDIKWRLKDTLKKFLTLFGGGLGTLLDCFPPVKIKLKEGVKPYVAMCYTLPRAYKQPARKDVDQMVAIGLLKKLQ